MQIQFIRVTKVTFLTNAFRPIQRLPKYQIRRYKAYEGVGHVRGYTKNRQLRDEMYGMGHLGEPSKGPARIWTVSR